MIKMVFFDLDGTLLPMDQDHFVEVYFRMLAKKMAPRGYEPKKLFATIWGGTGVMVKNDGGCTNEEAFWNYFASVYGEEGRRDIPVFHEFYRVEFQEAQSSCGFNPEAKGTVEWLKGRGLRVTLATNPIFPSTATETRVRWAGLEPADFEFFTTYENSRFCKPNLAYYRWLLDRHGCRAEETLMVGNDVDEDMVAEKLGMKVFLLTDCMINKSGTDISRYPQGSFEELRQYVEDFTSES